jgi:methionyl-tRNA formyltransferase
LYPWPHAHTYLNGARLIIRRTRVDSAGRKAPPYERGGVVVNIDHDAILVMAGNGEELAVLEIQPEGRRPMSVRDFVAGHRLAAGDSFSSS